MTSVRPKTPDVHNGHVSQSAGDAIPFADTQPDATAWRQEHRLATGWRAREPRHVHSMKWHDAEGIEHLHVVRSDDLDDVLKEMGTIKQCIRAAKAKAAAQRQQATPQTPTAPAAQDACPIHHVPMEVRTGKHGPWRQHTLPDGTVCKGKPRQARR